jgi:hypothetical protein
MWRKGLVDVLAERAVHDSAPRVVAGDGLVEHRRRYRCGMPKSRDDAESIRVHSHGHTGFAVAEFGNGS